MNFHDARIIYIDVNRMCCDTISIDGNFYTEDVSYTNTGLKKSGALEHPELGDVAVIGTDDDGGSSIVRWYTARTTDDNNLTKFIAGHGGNLALNKHLPGDRVISGPDGAWLSLLRGKLATVGSSPLCQTIYAGVEGLIRTVCQNYDAMGSGFRVFSINSGDEVLTRLCFSGSDRNFVAGANTNEDAMSENFEYQIDFNKEGITLFVGDIDPITKKRNPNLTAYLKPNGDIKVVCGKNIIYDIFANGIMVTTVVDDSHKTVYEKTVGQIAGMALLEEKITGDVVRIITGNLYQSISGELVTDAALVRNKADVIDNVSKINIKKTGINDSKIEIAPDSKVKIK